MSSLLSSALVASMANTNTVFAVSAAGMRVIYALPGPKLLSRPPFLRPLVL